jgi:DNA-binding transcriptional MerR regulator
LTGRCRGVKFKKDSTVLARNGERGACVTLATDGNDFVNSVADAKTASLPWSPDMIAVLCNPHRLALIDQEARQKIFTAIFNSGNGGTVGKALAEAVNLGDLFPTTDAALTPMLEYKIGDLEKCVKATVERRREAKRGLEEIERAQSSEPPKLATVGTATMDLSRRLSGKIRERIADLSAQLMALPKGGNLIDEREVSERIGVLEDTIKVHQDKREALKARIAELLLNVQSLASGLDVAREVSISAKATEATLHAQIVKLSEGGGCVLSTDSLKIDCPLKVKTGESSPIQAVIRQVESLAKKALDEMHEADANIAGIKEAIDSNKAEQTKAAHGLAEIEESIRVDEAELATARKDLADAKAWPETNKKIDDLTMKWQQGEEVLPKSMAYEAWMDANAAVLTRRPELEAEIAQWDTLAKLIEEGGPLRAHLSKAVAAADLDAKLCESWGMAVKVEPDGSILVNGRPVELCSETEQWRAGLLVADLLARVSKVGWICVDRVDILDKAMREPLMEWAQRASSAGYSNVVMFCTESEPPQFKRALPSGVKAYWINGDHQTEEISA